MGIHLLEKIFNLNRTPTFIIKVIQSNTNFKCLRLKINNYIEAYCPVKNILQRKVCLNSLIIQNIPAYTILNIPNISKDCIYSI